nr:cupin-like domain-containing protein [Bacteriovorax sp. HI3]
MKNLKCLQGEINPKNLDRKPFGFSHNLANHPSLSFENLSRVITTMPEEKVMFSKGLNDLNKDFEQVLVDGKKGFDLHEVIETIRTGNAYIAVRNPELDPSFKDIFEGICHDVGEFMKKNGTGTKPLEPMLWLFIASPGSITPFHFDRYSNFIMQIRGSKELAVFPPRVEEVISSKELESYIDNKPAYPEWNEEKDKHAHKFNFKSGEAVHIPYTSGHYVKNGMDDISITISVFYHTEETLGWSKAMMVNNRMRRMGITPKAVGKSALLDRFKSAMVLPLLDNMYAMKSKLRTSARYSNLAVLTFANLWSLDALCILDTILL